MSKQNIIIRTYIRFDKWIERLHKRLKKSIIARGAMKLCSEIFLAIIISIAVYLGTSMYNSAIAEREDNRKISQVYISSSSEYIDSQFLTLQIRSY